MGLTGDEILAADDTEVRKVPTPEWGGDGHVFVRVMSGTARDRWEQYALKQKEANKGEIANIRGTLAVAAVCDEAGVLLWKPDQAQAVGEKSGNALDRVFDAINDLNGLTEKASDAIAGNSPGDPECASGSS